ncbi:hypothetical protein EG877_16900, partial [Enterococcus faecalis]
PQAEEDVDAHAHQERAHRGARADDHRAVARDARRGGGPGRERLRGLRPPAGHDGRRGEGAVRRLGPRGSRRGAPPGGVVPRRRLGQAAGGRGRRRGGLGLRPGPGPGPGPG